MGGARTIVVCVCVCVCVVCVSDNTRHNLDPNRVPPAIIDTLQVEVEG